MSRFQVFVRVIHQTKVCVDACIRHSHDECDAGIRIIISPYSMEDHVQIFINVPQSVEFESVRFIAVVVNLS